MTTSKTIDLLTTQAELLEAQARTLRETIGELRRGLAHDDSISADAAALTIAQTCRVLGLSRGTVAAMQRSGKLTSTTVGRRVLISRASVEALLP